MLENLDVLQCTLPRFYSLTDKNQMSSAVKPAKVLGLYDTTDWVYYNPNTIKSYKIIQKLSPKHAARGVVQSPYPIYRHGKACLSEQPPWRAAGDPRLACGRSRVRAPGPASAARTFFLHPPFLPPSGDSFFRNFPTKPAKVLGLRSGIQKASVGDNRTNHILDISLELWTPFMKS